MLAMSEIVDLDQSSGTLVCTEGASCVLIGIVKFCRGFVLFDSV